MNFYSLTPKQAKNEVLLTFVDDFKPEDLFLNENINTNRKFKAKIISGKIFYDYNSFDDGINCIISKKFYDILNDNNITGFTTYMIDIENVEGEFYGFQIVGRSGALEIPKKIGFYKGYRFDESTWDRSDFFTPKNTCLRFISDGVKNLIHYNKLSNILTEDINEIEVYSFGK